MSQEEQRPAQPVPPVSRRQFLKSSAAASASVLLAGCASMQRQAASAPLAMEPVNTDTLRVGLIGCGGRGTGAAINCLSADPNVRIVALGDLFQDRLDACRSKLTGLEEHPQEIADQHCFVGFDAYQGVLDCDIDMVIHATPPGFRPGHLRAAIEAGKHVFTEKPVAVDPVGVRSVIATAALAEAAGLALVAGTQRRHDPAYIATMRRIHDGAIGDLVGGQCYWNQGALWCKERQPDWTDMEWQCRNWLYFTWLSGDHIVEQHIHNIDVMNWAFGGPPEKALGMGGREVRTDPKYGNVFDHFAVEFVYPGGARVMSMCRQIHGTSSRVAERLVGTHGVADPSGHIQGPQAFDYEPPGGEWVNPYEQEHRDLIDSIRRDKPLNEGRRVAESTLTAIMGRMSAYTGREVSWKWLIRQSELELGPAEPAFGTLPVAPVAVPGETALT
jgi:predicted dehydrogenase